MDNTKRVACLGLKEKDFSVAQTIINLLTTRNDFSWTLEHSPDADVLLLGADAPGAMTLLRRRAPDPNTRIILVYPPGFPLPKGNARTFFMPEPLTALRLLKTLDDIQKSFEFAPDDVPDYTEFTPTAAPEVAPEPAPAHPEPIKLTVTVQQDPEPRKPATIRELVDAVALLRANWGMGKLLDIANARGLFARLNSYPFESYALSLYMNRDDYTPHSPEEPFSIVFHAKTPERLRLSPIWCATEFEPLAWQIACHSCHSRTTLDLPPNHEMQLTRWPDFGALQQLSERPGVIMTTALLIRKFYTFDALRRESEIGSKDLCAMLAVCWINGWLQVREIGNRDSDDDAQAGTRTAFTGIIRGLRKVLGI
jgi:hypothetical protein